MKLRFQVQELQEQVRKERRRADRHAEELAVARRLQQMFHANWLNGSH